MSSYTTSSGSATFVADSEGWSEPATSAVGIRGFPGGNSIAISLAGRREVTRTVRCLFATRGDYVQFVLLRGTTGTLVIDNWDTVGAVLKEANPEPPSADGKVIARAQFVLT
jgi:hypothetical protein